MNKDSKFVPISEVKTTKKSNRVEDNFIVNEYSALRRKKERPENQLQPDLNEIQRFVKREN